MAIVKKYKATVTGIKNPLKDIYTVTFTTGKKFKYKPGQFLHLAIDNYDGVGQWPESRCFSMQSNPDDETIKITYAVKGSFTKAMKKSLRTGKEVWLKLPYGELFTQTHNKKNTVFIAGGTGITPFLSMFNSQAFHEYINPKIYLGFRSKEYNIYQNELNTIRNPNASVIIYYEDEVGVINIDEIFVNNGKHSSYFISGPPLMIKKFKHRLIELGLQNKKIITDDWE